MREKAATRVQATGVQLTRAKKLRLPSTVLGSPLLWFRHRLNWDLAAEVSGDALGALVHFDSLRSAAKRIVSGSWLLGRQSSGASRA